MLSVKFSDGNNNSFFLFLLKIWITKVTRDTFHFMNVKIIILLKIFHYGIEILWKYVLWQSLCCYRFSILHLKTHVRCKEKANIWFKIEFICLLLNWMVFLYFYENKLTAICIELVDACLIALSLAKWNAVCSESNECNK